MTLEKRQLTLRMIPRDLLNWAIAEQARQTLLLYKPSWLADSAKDLSPAVRLKLGNGDQHANPTCRLVPTHYEHHIVIEIRDVSLVLSRLAPDLLATFAGTDTMAAIVVREPLPPLAHIHCTVVFGNGDDYYTSGQLMFPHIATRIVGFADA